MELTHEDSIFIITFLVGAYLIGLLFGWWSGRRGKRKLRKELKQKEADLVSLRAEQKALQEQLELKEADLTKANLENEELKVKVSQVENEKAKLHNELFESSTALENLKAEHLTSLSQIESLNAQITSFEANSLSSGGGSDIDLSSVQTNYDNANIRLAAIEDKLSRLELENSNLKSEINSIKGDSSPITFIDDEVGNNDDIEIEDVAEEYADDLIMDPDQRASLARQQLQSAFGSRILVADAADKDDLKKINGIGPFIEQKLNDIGIYKFSQISQFDEDLINQITDAIQFFPGRIKRDDWVGQANKLK